MDRRSVSPARPRNLSFQDVDPPSASPSPASDSENKRWVDELGEESYDEVTEYIKEVDEILDYLKPFPRSQEHSATQDTVKPGLDHLENLIRLVEHLKDLKERNTQSRQKTLYLKELKLLREQNRRIREEDPLPPPVDSPRRLQASLQSGSRSKSVSSNEHEKPFPYANSHPSRSSLGPVKAKVSKWTKVKEAFRWEKTAQLEPRLKHGKHDRKLDHCQITTPEEGLPSSNRLLQVPCDKHGDTSSPADSVLSGQLSSGTSTSCLLASSGYSGEHSSTAHSSSSVHMLSDLGLLPHSFRAEYHDDSLSMSSSDDEKLIDDVSAPVTKLEDLNFDELPDDAEARRSRSLDGGTILGPTQHFLQHLSKESLQDASKSEKPHHKTPWGKVKDIIHTRRGSLKKKSKKREDFKAEAEAFSAALDLPSPDRTTKQMRPLLEITPCEHAHAPCLPARLPEHSILRPFAPVLTLTLPSSEELQKLASMECQYDKELWGAIDDETSRISDSHFVDEKGKIHGRSSRWGKVKRAFLTSGGSEEPSSLPSSPLHLGSFFADIESDECSSGDWMEQERKSADVASLAAVMKAEVQRNYSELQQKLCQELDASVAGCEMLQEVTPKVDERLKNEDMDKIQRKPRESLTIPMPTVDDLSPEFKKKLDEWKKIKKTPPTPTSVKEEVQSHFMTRIGDWQRWRPGAHKMEAPFKQEHHLQEDFYKKLEEWQMLKGTKMRSRSHSDRGKEDADIQTPSPGLSRNNSKGAVKKLTSSGKSSGSDSLGGSLKEKEGRAGRKTHREKDLIWLEKELQKIEREKLRLEREREKYMEREARLEQMKRTMGTTSPTQEVLIQTATGSFRFEGISQKFTKKLYEWEKAKGIAPEASTIALLEEASVAKVKPSREDRGCLPRSKSVGSVIDSGSIVAQSIGHHPSSLSLNDADDFEQATILDTSRASSEHDLEFRDDDEPEAIIVDVEDVEEETASPLTELQIFTHVPVYSYAPAEVTQLIDSSGSDGERDVHVLEVKAITPKNMEEKASLIDQNISLLEKMEAKEALLSREIEHDVECKDGSMSTSGADYSEETACASTVLSQCTSEGETPKHSFLENSEQQEELAHDLVGNMWLLHAAHASSIPNTESDVNQILDLSSQLLSLAQKLEGALSKRNTDVKNLRSSIHRRRQNVNKIASGKAWYSIDETASPDSCWPHSKEDQEVDELPSLITKKVLELKKGLKNLKDASAKPEGMEMAHTEHINENTASFTFQVGSTGRRVSACEPVPKEERTGKRPKLKISVSEEFVPPDNLSPVTVTLSPPLWKTHSKNNGESKRRLEKSKAQIFLSESSQDNFGMNPKPKSTEIEKKSPEVIKRRIKEKISEMQRLATESRPRVVQSAVKVCSEEVPEVLNEVHDDEKVVVVVRRGKDGTKKGLKTRRITDTVVFKDDGVRPPIEIDDNDDVFLQDTTPVEFQNNNLPGCSSTPSFVFVPTTRKIISPVETDSTSSVLSYIIDDIKSKDTEKTVQVEHRTEEKEAELVIEIATEDCQNKNLAVSCSPVDTKLDTKRGGDIGIPPLPSSPGSIRKITSKESSPSIRMMIAKYNQKITENQDSDAGAVPNGWRSPVLDRRIKDQLDRFQKDGTHALKHGAKFDRHEVQKSASAGLITMEDLPERPMSVDAQRQSVSSPSSNIRGILKSSSTGTMKSPSSQMPQNFVHNQRNELASASTPVCINQETPVLLASRAQKIREAKAEFLSRGPSGKSCDADSVCNTPVLSLTSMPFSWSISDEGAHGISKDSASRGNRLSHISVGSESSYEEVCREEELTGLTKSVSAGMINLERWDTLRRKSEGYVEETCVKKVIGHSLTETNLPLPKQSSRFGISNIKSRFRKVKMKKGKGKESAVSALCRQSLFLDVSQSADAARPQASTSKSCPSSPVLSRSRSDDAKGWIAGKLFKSKGPKQNPDDTHK